jgi:hypothetical protein
MVGLDPGIHPSLRGRPRGRSNIVGATFPDTAMFNRQIVLIVGAGASFDKYGLPLGGQLASGIANDTDFVLGPFIANRPIQGDADLFDSVIYSNFGNNKAALDRYTNAGRKLSAAIRSTISVDDALYQLSDYPEAVQLGKICIMRSILKAERNSTLKTEGASGELPTHAGRDGWIEHIFSMAITGFKLSEITHAFKRITFVNFNYDRCLEHYLFWSLQRLGISSDDASKTIQNLNIIRPYGTLGSAIPGTPSFLKFGAPPPSKPLDLISRIRTFTESDALHDKEKLSSALVDASLIAFLGFGFHPQNLKLLTLPPDRQLRRAKVLATVVGVDGANLPELTSTLCSTLRIDGETIETHSMTASEMLQKLRMKITMALG